MRTLCVKVGKYNDTYGNEPWYIILMFVPMICIVIGMSLYSIFEPDDQIICHTLGWHKRPKVVSNNGCSNKGVCPRCEKDVTQDSQGNWY